MPNSPSIYRFVVTYERIRKNGSTVYGSTLISSQRFNFGLSGAQDRLSDRFLNDSTFSIKALSVSPYKSGADRVKERRAAK